MNHFSPCFCHVILKDVVNSLKALFVFLTHSSSYLHKPATECSSVLIHSILFGYSANTTLWHSLPLHCTAQSLVLTLSAFLRLFRLLEARHNGEAKPGSDGWLTNLPYRFLIIAQILLCADIFVSFMQQKYEICAGSIDDFYNLNW